MSLKLTWPQRRSKLSNLLDVNMEGPLDEDGEAWALDDFLWGSRAFGRTPAAMPDVEKLRFTERDLEVIGTLARGQFGLVEVVRCRLNDRQYVCKSLDKALAIRTRDQCFPQTERDILLRARATNCIWVPHLLCAFQTSTQLSCVMDYAPGGTLWDVLESCPTGGRISEPDLRWWMSQAACAIEWCHMQGFVHRDIKPHNFVLTADCRLRLVDFGSAAPLLRATRDGVQLVPKRLCLVPCGTCDYISPEILQATEHALVALETDESVEFDPSEGGYGKETDWWSYGAMLYELAFGAAPFYANDVRRTYTKILDHKRSLIFDNSKTISRACTTLISSLLCHHETRLGRRNAREIKSHEFFDGIDWSGLHLMTAPLGLHLPQFTYSPLPPHLPVSTSYPLSEDDHEPEDEPFDFSALFHSSMSVTSRSRSLNASSSRHHRSARATDSASIGCFIGFSWGPALDAFHSANSVKEPVSRLLHPHAYDGDAPPRPQRTVPRAFSESAAFVTPLRPGQSQDAPHSAYTIPRTLGRRDASARRGLSDRESLRQLVECVTASAHKKILQSGRTPRHIILQRRGVAFRNTDDGHTTDDDASVPPSPSPSPRPGSAMSKRSASATRSAIGSSMISRMTPTMQSVDRLSPSPSPSFEPSRQRSPDVSRSRSQTPVPAALPQISADRQSTEDARAALARGIALMEAKHAELLQHIADVERKLLAAKVDL